jgi:arylsulfatase A-like enzyme
MKKKIIFLLSFLLLINLPPLRWIINIFTTENYSYTNFNGSFTCSENYGKGGSYENCVLNYADYLKMHAADKDRQLYRCFTLKPWRFWEWYKWIIEGRQRFSLPYTTEEQVKGQRRLTDH